MEDSGMSISGGDSVASSPTEGQSLTLSSPVTPTDTVVYGGLAEETQEMSERVQALAAGIYAEFEHMIKRYDEHVVKNLMPLTVNILENLDATFLEKQEAEVELELLRDDNEQLLTQYEREKQLRKASENKYLTFEDGLDEQKKNFDSKIESLESIIRMFELKAKNAHDHIARCEEKESEMRKEHTKLHDRYTELFKTHMDYMERAKMLMGFEKGMEMPGLVRSGKPVNLHLKATSPGSPLTTTPVDSSKTPIDHTLPSPSNPSAPFTNLEAELSSSNKEGGVAVKSQQLVSPSKKSDLASSNCHLDLLTSAKVTADMTSDSIDYADHLNSDDTDPIESPKPTVEEDMVTSTPKPELPKPPPNQSSLFEELGSTIHDMDDGAEITGDVVIMKHDDTKDEEKSLGHSDGQFYGMGREVENLIQENTELLAAKYALNIVKDDLIAQIDELNSEHEIFLGEIDSLRAVRDRLNVRVEELEGELKAAKEELHNWKEKRSEGADEAGEDIPMGQRKRFTRVEMARVLMERNQYKERLMELQEAVRWTEMIRASREHPEQSEAADSKKKSSVWGFFGSLMSSSSPSSQSSPKKKIQTPTVI